MIWLLLAPLAAWSLGCSVALPWLVWLEHRRAMPVRQAWPPPASRRRPRTGTKGIWLRALTRDRGWR